MIVLGVLLGIASYILFYILRREGYGVYNLARYGSYLSRALVFIGIGLTWKNRLVEYLFFYNISIFWIAIFGMYVYVHFFGTTEKGNPTELSMDTHLIFWVLLISITVSICLLLLFYFLRKIRSRLL